MSLFQKFQDKVSIIGNIAKEYIDEGVSFASQGLEKEQNQNIEVKGMPSYSPISLELLLNL